MLALFACLLVGLVAGKASEERVGHIQNNVEDVQRPVLDGPLCQNVVAYYEGTFTNEQHPNLNYTAQFQVQLNASQTERLIYVIFNRWNDTLLPRYPFSFDAPYADKDIIGDQIGSLYWGPFASNPTEFTLILDHDATEHRWDNSVKIMYFHTFNNSFQLENAIGQCTRKQLQLTDPWNMNTDLVEYCVCCGDYLPSEQLGCPVNPWAGPVKPTTPLPQTKTPPSSASVSCQSIVSYYSGTFKNEIFPDKAYPAQFQLRMTSDLDAQQYRLTVEGWNQTASRNSDFSMDFWCSNLHQRCDDITVNNTCSASFVGNNDKYLGLSSSHMKSTSWDNDFHLFGFDTFNRTFTFDAIGKCTANPPNFDDDYTPDPTLYKVCMCCDDYKPHPSLNCPKSQWA